MYSLRLPTKYFHKKNVKALQLLLQFDTTVCWRERIKSKQAIQCVPKIEHKHTCPVNCTFPFHLTKQESLK